MADAIYHRRKCAMSQRNTRGKEMPYDFELFGIVDYSQHSTR